MKYLFSQKWWFTFFWQNLILKWAWMFPHYKCKLSVSNTFKSVNSHHEYSCSNILLPTETPGECFTNISIALQNNLVKIYNARNHIYDENFKLKLCTCAQSMALGKRTKFQLEILIRSTISAIHKFQENILESSWDVSVISPRNWYSYGKPSLQYTVQRYHPRSWHHSDGLVQGYGISVANTMEIPQSCTKPLISRHKINKTPLIKIE